MKSDGNTSESGVKRTGGVGGVGESTAGELERGARKGMKN